MTEQELDKELNIAINEVEHPGYMAAARVQWPEALLQLREAYEALDKASARILSQMKRLEAADRLAWRATDYIMAFVRKGPFNCDEPARALIKAMHEYKELRGIEL